MPDAIPWMYGPSTAHLAKFMGDGLWMSRCRYDVRRYYNGPGDPIHWTGAANADEMTNAHGLPLVPWCSWCASLARSEATAFYSARFLDDLVWVIPPNATNVRMDIDWNDEGNNRC